MKDITEIENPYNYIENAKIILREKAIKNEGTYKYPKYVKMAGHIAWCGVLLALDELMNKNNIKIKGRKDFKDYIEFVRKRNKKILDHLMISYEKLHIFMGYDGNLSVHHSKIGLDSAKIIIDWVNKQLKYTK